jgi:hypothetical protein
MSGTKPFMLGDREVAITTNGWLKTASFVDEWYEDVDDPEQAIADLRVAGVNVDLFSFWQRLPYAEPRFPYHREWDGIAVLPVSTYDHWMKAQINNKTRNMIVRAKKKGVVVDKVPFDDEFVRGMTAIFNETPIRQERPFIHYGKSFERVKREFSRYLFREQMLGAYFEGQLIGFIMLADAGRYAMLGQIISMVQHRDKSPNNALVAKAVEVCAERKIPSLVYALWPRGPLREFKKHNGFECMNLPRYYVPLSAKGRLALNMGLHHNVVHYLPEKAIPYLRDLRSRFYAKLRRHDARGFFRANGDAHS